MCTHVCFFVSYQHPCSAHVGYIHGKTDRTLPMGHTLLLQPDSNEPKIIQIGQLEVDKSAILIFWSNQLIYTDKMCLSN